VDDIVVMRESGRKEGDEVLWNGRRVQR
jgi:hypothetical protein